MKRYLNLSGIILSTIVNLLICVSALFNFLLPEILAEYSINFLSLYILMPFILLIGMVSLTISVMLLFNVLGFYKNFKNKNIFMFILIGLNVLNMILYAIFMLLYGWGLIALNGFIIFTLLTTSSIFLLITNLTPTQNEKYNTVNATEKSNSAETSQENPNQNVNLENNFQKKENIVSPEDDLDNKLKILASMKNMNIITDDEFSEIKKKLVYDYLNKKGQ